MQGIHALEFAEVENLMCVASMIESVAIKLELDPTEVLKDVTTFVSRALREELEAQIVMRAARRVRYHLSCYTASNQDRSGLQDGIDQLVSGLDLQSIVTEAEGVLTRALDSMQLNDLLKVYNRKSLAARIAGCFGLKQGEYAAMVMRLLKGPEGPGYVKLLSAHLPVY